MTNIFVIVALCSIVCCQGIIYDERPDESPSDIVDERSMEEERMFIPPARMYEVNADVHIEADDDNFRQKKVWELINMMDGYKNSRIYSQRLVY